MTTAATASTSTVPTRRGAPDSRIDAIYERVIEIQERQQSFNEQLLAAGIRREEILDKMAQVVGRMSPQVEAVHHQAGQVDMRIGEVMKEIDKRMWFLFVATFAGSALGNSLHAVVDWIWRLKP